MVVASPATQGLMTKLQEIQENMLKPLGQMLEQTPSPDMVEFIDMYLGEASANIEQLHGDIVNSNDDSLMGHFAISASEFQDYQKRAEDWKLQAGGSATAAAAAHQGEVATGQQSDHSEEQEESEEENSDESSASQQRGPSQPERDQQRDDHDAMQDAMLLHHPQMRQEEEQERCADAQRNLQEALAGPSRDEVGVISTVVEEARSAGVAATAPDLFQEGERRLKELQEHDRLGEQEAPACDAGTEALAASAVGATAAAALTTEEAPAAAENTAARKPQSVSLDEPWVSQPGPEEAVRASEKAVVPATADLAAKTSENGAAAAAAVVATPPPPPSKGVVEASPPPQLEDKPGLFEWLLGGAVLGSLFGGATVAATKQKGSEVDSAPAASPGPKASSDICPAVFGFGRPRPVDTKNEALPPPPPRQATEVPTAPPRQARQLPPGGGVVASSGKHQPPPPRAQRPKRDVEKHKNEQAWLDQRTAMKAKVERSREWLRSQGAHR